MAKDKHRESQGLTVADVGKINPEMGMLEKIEGDEFSLDQFQKVTDAANLIERLTQEHLEWAHEQGLIGEKLFVMKPGNVIRGRFMGEGPPVVLHNRQQLNKETGEMGPPVIKTWRFQHASGNFIRILSNYQLDREMPEVAIGATVQVIHGGQKDTGNGQRVNDMLVQYPRKNAIVDATRVVEADVVKTA